MDSNVFLQARAVGLGVFSSSNVTINNMIVGDVRKRPELVMQKTVDKEACYTMCAYLGAKDSKCFDNTITNSIAAGCQYAGFISPGHDCEDSANS